MKYEINLKKLLIITLFIIFSINLTNKNAYAWDADTHKWILLSAVDILKQNEGDRIPSRELVLLNNWLEYVEQGIRLADYKPLLNDVFTYGCHFYDPDTGRSFIPTKTAKTMGIHYFEKAGNTYKEGHLLRAFYYLGLSLHYLSDLTQPMHAANFTNISVQAPLYHSRFETFAISRHKYCKVADGQGHWGWKGENPGNWIQAAAVDAKKDFPSVYNQEIRGWIWKSLYHPAYTRRWEDVVVPVVEKRLTEAQRILAGYIHLWFETYTSE